MKTIFLLLLAALAFAATAQPQKIHYQGVAVGSNGKPIKNSTVGLRLSVLDSLPTGTTLYAETQTASTDASGQFSIFLGGGTATAGTFANLPWANGNDKFLKVEMDAQGGSNYQPMGTTQLVSVPYAMVANAIRGSNGQMYQVTVGANGPILTCYPPVTLANAGPDQLALTGTTATLAANSPAAGETGTWSIISGNGGSFSSTSNTGATFTKGSDSAYTLCWSINGTCGISQDTIDLLFQNFINVPSPSPSPCPGLQTVFYSGENYPTVQIGNQCWMAKNLNVGTMLANSNIQTNNGTIEKFCYQNILTNCDTFGGLYQWAEAVQFQIGASSSTSPNPGFSGFVKGICPIGWHIPNDAEWNVLETSLGGSSIAGGALKSTISLWAFPNVGATNTSGFSALPGGFCNSNGSFNDLGSSASFWSTSEFSPTDAFSRSVFQFVSNVFPLNYNKLYGYSIRCLKD